MNKSKWNKIFAYFIIFLFFISSVLALDNCRGVITLEELPCNVLLEFNVSSLDCGAYFFSLYSNDSLLYIQTMANYSPYLCSGIINVSSVGTYSGQYSTGDAFIIIVEEGLKMIYLFYLAIAFTVVFFILSLWKDDVNFAALSAFGFLGIGAWVIMYGISIYNNLITYLLGALLASCGAYILVRAMEVWFDF